MEILEFENTSALDIALAEQVAESLQADINASGSASLVVSVVVHRWVFPFAVTAGLDWSAVTVALDERWVDNQRNSNEKLVRENLLINNARQTLCQKCGADATEGEADLESPLAVGQHGVDTGHGR